VMLIPQGLSMVDAAIMPENFMTVWAHLFMRAKFSAGKSILIHGGTSGIGTTATMLCRALGATKIFTTVGSEAQQQASLTLGADVAINYHTEDFVAQVKQHTNDMGVDYVLDIIGGDYVARNYQAAALNGTIVQIGVAHGKVQDLDLFPMLAKRLTHLGATLRSQTVQEKAEIIRQLKQSVWPLFAAGKIKPQLFKSYALMQAHLAHAQLAEGGHIGKLVLLKDC
ncbi:MAG: NAD(P)H-quinone oxidoreductase, partial [Moraxellaceae bacterium]